MTWGYKQIRPKWWVFLIVFLVFTLLAVLRRESLIVAFIILGSFFLILILNEIIFDLWFWVVEKLKAFFKEEGKRP